MALQRKSVPDVLANMTGLGMTAVTVDAKGRKLDINPALEPEYATDKDQVKIVPCRNDTCRRPMIVTTFFTPEKAICRACQGEAPGEHKATVGVPEPGITDPAKAVDLSKCLINQQFATCVCPVCIEDMELKSVNHNDHYGPGRWVHSNKGAIWHQDAKGETVMFQCNSCLLVLTMSTTSRFHFRRQNEVRPGKNANAWADINGTREADEIGPVEAAA